MGWGDVPMPQFPHWSRAQPQVLPWGKAEHCPGPRSPHVAVAQRDPVAFIKPIWCPQQPQGVFQVVRGSWMLVTSSQSPEPPNTTSPGIRKSFCASIRPHLPQQP